jgi:hypothetical protein
MKDFFAFVFACSACAALWAIVHLLVDIHDEMQMQTCAELAQISVVCPAIKAMGQEPAA